MQRMARLNTYDYRNRRNEPLLDLVTQIPGTVADWGDMRTLSYLFGLLLIVVCTGVAARISGDRGYRLGYDAGLKEF
jgi:hypothetical protein